MGVLARIFEEAGMATVGLSLVRRQAENIKAPRFLHGEFPLGRPLGKPNDPDFQTDVIRRAFALLERTDVPVIEDHPEEILDEVNDAATCTLPPRHDPDLHPAVDEAKAILPAYRRQVDAAGGRTAVGRTGSAEDMPTVVEGLIRVADGASMADAGFDADSIRAAGQDIRAYYEEAGLALSEHVPAARRIESWFYGETETGAVVKRAAVALEQAGEDRSTWYYLLPGSQQ